MNLFLDTNVWLSFYHLSSDDLEELHKLAVLIDERRVTLYLPEQVINEFRRNREVKIVDGLNRMKQEMLNGQFPQICKGYEEFDKLRELISAYNETKSRLIEKLTVDVNNSDLKADSVIENLFRKANEITLSDDIWAKAKLRFDLGNPPGKGNSYGDAVNWTTLLDSVPNDQDIYFVSEDGDYSSIIAKDDFSPFLRREWANKKHGEVRYFKKLSGFFRDQFPQIKLAKQLGKELLLHDLETSSSFATTRSVLRKLSKYSDFTNSEIAQMATSVTTNAQIFWIATDKDIQQYLNQLLGGSLEKIEADVLPKVLRVLAGEEILSSTIEDN